MAMEEGDEEKQSDVFDKVGNVLLNVDPKLLSDLVMNVNNLMANPPKRNDALIKGFVNCAEQDIEATKLLFSNKSYPLAVYHLQQATEKLAKAYALSLNFITEKELREISHKSPVAFIKAINNTWMKSYLDVLKNVNQNINTDTAPLQKVINEDYLELAKTPKEGVVAFCKIIESARNGLNIPQMKTQINAFLDVFSESFENAELTSRLETVKSQIDQKLNADNILSFAALYLFSAVTFPHEAYTRYPNREIKPEDYKEGMGIVDSIDLILPHLEQAVSSIKSFYKTS